LSQFCESNITLTKKHLLIELIVSKLNLCKSQHLQGPLHNLCTGVENDSQVQVAESEGRAVSLLYNSVSKDSVLVATWSSGELQIDALADEIQPGWEVGSSTRLFVDSNDCILGVAMICESVSSDLSFLKSDQTPDRTVLLGYPPALLRLAIQYLPGRCLLNTSTLWYLGFSRFIWQFIDRGTHIFL
jgi:hypothetical protein